jgi:pimeloyl-ACP methyl ester carboxylesterase
MDLIFVHGALVRDGEWWWRPTARLLEERTGIRSRAITLPSCGEVSGPAVGAPGPATTAASRGLVADAAALRRALDDVEHAVVVGHSYGGTVIAETGHHPAIAHLVLISSYLPEVGATQAAILADEPDPVAIAPIGDGSLALDGYDEAAFGARFLQDGTPEQQREAFARLARQHVESFVTPTTQAGWQGVDSTYLVCADDRSTTPALQRRHAARATRAIELPTGHHPFLTRPDLVADAIAELGG